MVSLPVTEEVYGRFMLDPGMAERYLSKVEEFDVSGVALNLELPQQQTESGPDQTSLTPAASELEAIGLLEPLPPEVKPLPLQLTFVADADVVIETEGTTIRRVDKDPNRKMPAVTIYGISNNFALDASFEVTLSQKDPEQIVKVDDFDDIQVWALNPRHGVTYSLRRKG